MVGKASDPSIAGVHIREGDHRGGRGIGGIEEQWVFVHEVSEGGFSIASSRYAFTGRLRLSKPSCSQK